MPGTMHDTTGSMSVAVQRTVPEHIQHPSMTDISAPAWFQAWHFISWIDLFSYFVIALNLCLFVPYSSLRLRAHGTVLTEPYTILVEEQTSICSKERRLTVAGLAPDFFSLCRSGGWSRLAWRRSHP